MGEEDLPWPWTAIDSDDGDKYYYNEETGESRWELPGAEGEDNRSDHEDHEEAGGQDGEDRREDWDEPGEEWEPLGPHPEIICHEVCPVEKDALRVRAVCPQSDVLSFIPDGSQASLSCAPRVLFRIEAVRRAEPAESAQDELPPGEDFHVDLVSLEPGWPGLEAPEPGCAITVFLAGPDLEEALFAAVHSLMWDSEQAGSGDPSQASGSWTAPEVLVRAKELFPEVVGEDMTEVDVEAALESSALLEASWLSAPLAEEAPRVVCKTASSPLEEFTLQVFTDLARAPYHQAIPMSAERPWRIIADEHRRSMGQREEDLDRRFMEASRHFVFSYSESRGHVMRLRNPPAEEERPEERKHGHHQSQQRRYRQSHSRNGERHLHARRARRMTPRSPPRRGERRSERSGLVLRPGDRHREADRRPGHRGDGRRSRSDRRRPPPRRPPPRAPLRGHRREEHRRDRRSPRRSLDLRDKDSRRVRADDRRPREPPPRGRPRSLPRNGRGPSPHHGRRSREASRRGLGHDRRPGRSRSPHRCGRDRPRSKDRGRGCDRGRRSRSRGGRDRRHSRHRSPPKQSIEDRLAALLHNPKQTDGGPRNAEANAAAPASGAGVWQEPSQPVHTEIPPPSDAPPWASSSGAAAWTSTPVRPSSAPSVFPDPRNPPGLLSPRPPPGPPPGWAGGPRPPGSTNSVSTGILVPKGGGQKIAAPVPKTASVRVSRPPLSPVPKWGT
mmetsp:Transcript_122428/g.235974  ORF Transcript_122428/g.235974 Transcript_122428/m.235974 type:complete len:727 (+) Transcript_122428:94-2274(+)